MTLMLENRLSFQNEKPFLWLYWKNVSGKKTPYYILKCHENIKLYCEKDFKVVILNEKTVKKYISDLIPEYEQLNQVAHKADYLRFKLLYKYGGIWLDSDTILFRSLKEVIQKIAEVGFVCMGYFNDSLGKVFPLIAFLGAIKGSEICLMMIQNMEKKIKAKIAIRQQPTWDEIGGKLLADLIISKKVFVYPSEVFCPIPIHNKGIIDLFLPLKKDHEKKCDSAFGQTMSNSTVGDFVNFLGRNIFLANMALAYVFCKGFKINLNLSSNTDVLGFSIDELKFIMRIKELSDSSILIKSLFKLMRLLKSFIKKLYSTGCLLI